MKRINKLFLIAIISFIVLTGCNSIKATEEEKEIAKDEVTPNIETAYNAIIENEGGIVKNLDEFNRAAKSVVYINNKISLIKMEEITYFESEGQALLEDLIDSLLTDLTLLSEYKDNETIYSRQELNYLEEEFLGNLSETKKLKKSYDKFLK